MSQSTLFITHKALPGKRDAVRRAWETHLAPSIESRKIHDAYFYCYDDSDPDTIRVFQRYAEGADPQAFMLGPAYEAYVAAVTPLLAHPPEIHAATVAWAKHLTATKTESA
ncbi:MAG: antibiotic biosynthesis monooxygenase [Halomonas sp.]|uniref:Antibiotic biosynthesis monooxygenase n=1 Tax=Halomonas sulfidivorans TaxID=2733488 RepID=A0ABX7WC98_9GAMM|nr:antibiotic biosynthesis monooxygenase [Halomonas sulfidivorans]MDX5379611.1 antibiotic biosynthesis monooxygenase [Halomonas sp.]QTP57925.1 antibiotic biosynthesis monooxygenase [Halomonas sulfidivorans]